MLHEVSPPITSTMQGDIRDDSSRLNLTFVWEIEGTESEREMEIATARPIHTYRISRLEIVETCRC